MKISPWLVIYKNIFSISSRLFPFVSGSRKSENRAPNVLKIPNIQKTKWSPIPARKSANVNVTMNARVHDVDVTRADAIPVQNSVI